MPTNRASMKATGPQARRPALAAYIAANGIVIPPGGGALRGIQRRFSSFANTMQTRVNSSNGTVSALGGNLEAQVDRALAQALRQSGTGAATAVADRPEDASVASLVGGTAGALPTMSPYQATMLREGRITQADILSFLNSLQPLSPFTDAADVASLQAVARAEVNGLLEEFSYTRLLPRQQRVRVFLGGLLGWGYDLAGVTSPFQPGAPAGDIQALVALLNLGGPLIPTVPIEDQLASQQAVGTDGALFDTEWNVFWSNALSPPSRPATWSLWENAPGVLRLPGPGGLGPLLLSIPPPATLTVLGPRSSQLPMQAPLRLAAISPIPLALLPGPSYAERMIQVNMLLPVIAEDASRVANSLTAAGFTTGEQEAQFTEFWSAVDGDLLLAATRWVSNAARRRRLRVAANTDPGHHDGGRHPGLGTEPGWPRQHGPAAAGRRAWAEPDLRSGG